MLATHTDGVLTGPQTLTLSFGEIFIGESSLVHRGRGVPPPSSVLRHMVASRSCDRLYKHLLANWPAGKHLTAALALRYARCAIAALLLPSIVGSGGLGLGRVTRTATWTNDCVFFTSANAADMV